MYEDDILKHIKVRSEEIDRFTRDVCTMTRELNQTIDTDWRVDIKDIVEKLAKNWNLELVNVHYDYIMERLYPEVQILPHSYDILLKRGSCKANVSNVCDVRVDNVYSRQQKILKNMNAYVYKNKSKFPFFMLSSIVIVDMYSNSKLKEEEIYRYDIDHYKFEDWTLIEEIDIIRAANKIASENSVSGCGCAIYESAMQDYYM